MTGGGAVSMLPFMTSTPQRGAPGYARKARANLTSRSVLLVPRPPDRCRMGGPEMGQGGRALPGRPAVHGARQPTGRRHMDGRPSPGNWRRADTADPLTHGLWNVAR